MPWNTTGRNKETIDILLIYLFIYFPPKDPVKFEEQIRYGKLMNFLEEESEMVDSQGK